MVSLIDIIFLTSFWISPLLLPLSFWKLFCYSWYILRSLASPVCVLKCFFLVIFFYKWTVQSVLAFLSFNLRQIISSVAFIFMNQFLSIFLSVSFRGSCSMLPCTVLLLSRFSLFFARSLIFVFVITRKWSGPGPRNVRTFVTDLLLY